MASVSFIHLFFLVGSGILLGMTALFLPPVWAASLPLSFVALWFVARRPEIGVLVILGYTSTILEEAFMPLLPIGVGSLHISDLVLLWLYGVLVFRVVVIKDLKFQRTPLDFPIFLFLIVSVLSTAKGIFFSTTDFHEGVRELRYVAYYAIFFLVTNLVNEQRQLQLLCRGMMVFAVVTAVGMLLQSVVGQSLTILPGRVESLYTAGTRYESITRVIPPGESLIYVGFIVASASMAWGATRIDGFLKFLRFSLLGIGLLLTFRRMLWGTAALSLLGIGMVIPADYKTTFIRWTVVGFTAMVIAVAGVLLLMPKSPISVTIVATAERVSTIFKSETYKRGDVGKVSLETRRVEFEYALPQIIPPSLIGIGFGAAFRPCLPLDDDDPADDSDCTVRNYIHNGHVGILLKLGLVGYIAFFWLSLLAIRRGLKNWHCVNEDEAKTRVLAFTMAYIGLVLASMLEPYFILWSWTPVIAIILGYNETVIRNTMRLFNPQYDPIVSHKRVTN